MDNLVARLCEGDHPVELMLLPEKSTQILSQCLQRQYVHIKFTDTQGGTELGVRLEGDGADVSNADLAKLTGCVRLKGGLTLNFVKVRCVATIELSTLQGTGHLELAS